MISIPEEKAKEILSAMKKSFLKVNANNSMYGKAVYPKAWDEESSDQDEHISRAIARANAHGTATEITLFESFIKKAGKK